MKKHLLLSISLLAAFGLVAAPSAGFAQAPAQQGRTTGVQSAPAQRPAPAQHNAGQGAQAAGSQAGGQSVAHPAGQTAAVPQAQGAGQGQDQAGGAPDEGGQAQADEGQQQQQQAIPVRMIASVEVMRSAGQPTLDIVRVRGLTTSDGWGEPQLVAMGPSDPADGILDLVLVAVPPSDSVEANGAAPIEAIMPMEPGAPYKGIRVRSATNAITLDRLPGLAEVQVPASATVNYVGKRLLARGEAMPGGMTADDVVRFEDLPDDTRVITPDAGVSDVTADPNRLTLLVGADGKIQSAYWN
jgi:hypothetical protein